MAFTIETDVPITLKEVQELILKTKVTCRWDETPLGKLIDSYDHDGGIPLKGYDKKQWVFCTCPGCGHDWSLVHLLHRINDHFMEGMK